MTPFNHSLFQTIHGLAGRFFLLDAFGIFGAQYLPYFLVAGFLALALLQKGFRRKCYVFAEGALAVILARGILTPVIQAIFHEPRPFTVYGFAPLIGESGWSFPSAHASLFFALAMAAWYANRKWGAWYLALTILMAVARIYTGVHWPIDIIAGAAVGIGSAALIHWLLRKERQEIASLPAPSSVAAAEIVPPEL